MTTPSNRWRFPLLAAGIFGLVGVALGAMGAHALKVTLMERGMQQAWETAARYHLVHALALLGAAACVRTISTDASAALFTWAARAWCVGIVLFSGSLYWLALGGPRWLGPVTPFGGIALMAGWMLVVVVALRKPR